MSAKEPDWEWLETKLTPITRDWCPECEPAVDPVRECVVVERCGLHRLAQEPVGADDGKVARAYVAPVIEPTAIGEGGWL